MAVSLPDLRTGHLRAGALVLMAVLFALLATAEGCGERNEVAEQRPRPEPEKTVDAPLEAGAPDSAPPDGGDVDRGRSVVGPIGLAAMSGEAFERLPLLRRSERAFRESSFDRTGGNDDRVIKSAGTLYTDARGDRVLLDTVGPGCVYRLWFTFIDPRERIRFYFDGEAVPRLDVRILSLFDGKTPPFSPPLVGDATVSSGGFFSYVPLPFAKSLKVATTNVGEFYYQIDHHLFDPDVPVITWTGTEDDSAARAVWNAAGADPKAEHPGTVIASSLVSIPAKGATTLLDVAGPRSITRIHLALPGVAPMREGDYTDVGRAFTGESSFTMKLDPLNEGAVLQRRLDFGIADQKALIFVDDLPAGTWLDRGVSGTFRDHSFVIPSSLTTGKSTIHVRVVFDSSADDWNEFYYWAYSRVRGKDVLTDELDVGDAASEVAHGYAVEGQTFHGSRSSKYPEARAMAAPLEDLRLRITWDDAAQPSVDAPLGAFFAQGHYGPGLTSGLAAGIGRDGVMYMYFPMPFAKRAKVELVNEGTTAYDRVWYELRHRPYDDPFGAVGYFSTAFHAATPSVAGKDLVFLEAQGAGTVVGVVQSENGPPIRGYLEGDDRVHIDGRRTPQIQGTGTEDLYTGGFYFNRGPYTLPLNGNPVHYANDEDDGTSMYRFFVPDVIPYRGDIRFTIEHGPANDVSVHAWTLAYYYAQSTSRIALTDTLVIGDAKSEQTHAYTVTSATFEGSRTYTFEREDPTPMTASGRAHTGTSSFELAIAPENEGVLLRRLFDQHIGRQRARVYVDGIEVGELYTPHSNPAHAWREDEIALPASATSGKTKLRLRIEFVSSTDDWNEFEYRALSVLR